MPEYYEIKIKGHLDPRWWNWFIGCQLSRLEGNETLLSGPLPDQAALHGLLERIRDLNNTLITVTCAGASTHTPLQRDDTETRIKVQQVHPDEMQIRQAFRKEYEDYRTRVDRLVPFKRP